MRTCAPCREHTKRYRLSKLGRRTTVSSSAASSALPPPAAPPPSPSPPPPSSPSTPAAEGWLYVVRKPSFAPDKFKVGLTRADDARAVLVRRYGDRLGGEHDLRVQLFAPAAGLTLADAERGVLLGLRAHRYGREWFHDTEASRACLASCLGLFADRGRPA